MPVGPLQRTRIAKLPRAIKRALLPRLFNVLRARGPRLGATGSLSASAGVKENARAGRLPVAPDGQLSFVAALRSFLTAMSSSSAVRGPSGRGMPQRARGKDRKSVV